MSRTGTPFSAATFDFGPPRPMGLRPGVQPEWLFGYYQLERSERFATLQATDLHQDFVIAWYRLLDGYYRALHVPRVYGKREPWVTVWKILRLGLSAAKGALDATLAGSYVGAFGDIRQMAEYWFGVEYLAMNPKSINGFYRAELGAKQIRLPYMGTRVSEVLEAFAPEGRRADADSDRIAHDVNKTYKRMSDGHHLDGLAMVQTGDPNDPPYNLGATHDPSLAREALYHGTKMTGILAMTDAMHMGDLNPNWQELSSAIHEAMHLAIEQLPLREDSTENS